ncbi:hypothetical protein Tco_0875228 [Tanacetum coccineum]|uniref:PIN-like protein n=1 Tax=Tanacetum coccineum TaxID=301880 RepID=A0ABQ5BRN6_9ASTR
MSESLHLTLQFFRVKFATVILGTLVCSSKAYLVKILEEVSLIALPLVLVALLPMSVWVLMTYPTPAINAPKRLALTIASDGTDVFVSFFTNFLFLVLYYLQLKVGSYLSSGLAHLLCLILLYLEIAALRKRVMIISLVLSSLDSNAFDVL